MCSGADSRIGREAMGPLPMLIAGSRQFFEQRLRLFEVRRVEAFCEPAVDRREEVGGFAPLALVAPKAGDARGRA